MTRNYEVVRLLKKGWKQSMIAEKFNVTPQRVEQIVNSIVCKCGESRNLVDNGIKLFCSFCEKQIKINPFLFPKLYTHIKKEPERFFLNKFGRDYEGRGRTRMLVRLRDEFTCQVCKSIRTPEMIVGKIRLYDIHHLNGMCGKKSRGYDRLSEMDGLITLCHRCHFNHPEHSQKLMTK